MVKAIFFDIDGTLLNFKKPRYVPESTIHALTLLHNKGIKLFIATGRSPAQIDELKAFISFPFDGYVSMNGQYCFNDDGVIHHQPLAIDDLKSLLTYLETTKLGCHFLELDYIYLNEITDQVCKVWDSFGKPVTENIIDHPNRTLTHPTYQLSVYLTPDEEEALLKHLPNSKSVRWHPDFAEIIAKTGGKNVGIQQILNHYGIDLSETMAFGDGGNDKDMLEFVQIGVAMGNATDDVKAIANYVTTSVDDDGILNALKHFGIINTFEL